MVDLTTRCQPVLGFYISKTIYKREHLKNSYFFLCQQRSPLIMYEGPSVWSLRESTQETKNWLIILRQSPYAVNPYKNTKHFDTNTWTLSFIRVETQRTTFWPKTQCKEFLCKVMVKPRPFAFIIHRTHDLQYAELHWAKEKWHHYYNVCVATGCYDKTWWNAI